MLNCTRRGRGEEGGSRLGARKWRGRARGSRAPPPGEVCRSRRPAYCKMCSEGRCGSAALLASLFPSSSASAIGRSWPWDSQRSSSTIRGPSCAEEGLGGVFIVCRLCCVNDRPGTSANRTRAPGGGPPGPSRIPSMIRTRAVSKAGPRAGLSLTQHRRHTINTPPNPSSAQLGPRIVEDDL